MLKITMLNNLAFQFIETTALREFGLFLSSSEQVTKRNQGAQHRKLSLLSGSQEDINRTWFYKTNSMDSVQIVLNIS
jgi:hypothetical protein